MKARVAGLLAGTGIGFVFAWSGLSDPQVIGDMLMLREARVFLLMGSAIAVAFIGLRLLRLAGARALVGAPVAWTTERVEPRHVWGSLLFGAGWSLAGTCPGPVAVMIGQGQLAGLLVAAGLFGGIVLRGRMAMRGKAAAVAAAVV